MSVPVSDTPEVDDEDEDEDDNDAGEDGHSICSRADVPITGRSSAPDDALSSGEYKKRSTSTNDVTGVGIRASMAE